MRLNSSTGSILICIFRLLLGQKYNFPENINLNIYIINMSAHVQTNVQLRLKLLHKRVLNPWCCLNICTFFKFSLFPIIPYLWVPYIVYLFRYRINSLGMHWLLCGWVSNHNVITTLYMFSCLLFEMNCYHLKICFHKWHVYPCIQSSYVSTVYWFYDLLYTFIFYK